jgi:hypothetical protein
MPKTRYLALASSLAVLAVLATAGEAQTLRGSLASVTRQRDEALRHEYTFLEKSSDVARFVRMGLLVRVRPGANYELAGVSHPYARPAILTFIENLSGEYRKSCGERLVVTSLTRPSDRQPRNASAESVHPAGMAVDLRVSTTAPCRKWLERKLLALEKEGVVEATRERHPSHFHVAVFPDPYVAFLQKNGAHTAG